MPTDYSLSLVTAPAAPPLEVGPLRDWLRVDDGRDDPVILTLLDAATEAAELLLNRQLVTATWRMGLCRFPRGPLRLPRAPLQSVTSITYYDQANVLQTLASTVYDVDAVSDPGTISLAYAQSWPVPYQRPNAILIQFVAGYGAAATIPKGILTALRYAVNHAYFNRGDTDGGGLVTKAVEDALRMYWNGAFYYGEVG